MKTITLKLTGYVAGCTKYKYCMNDIYFGPEKEPSKGDIQAKINDGGFGFESLEGAKVELYENYEGHLHRIKHFVFKKEELTNAKKGI